MPIVLTDPEHRVELLFEPSLPPEAYEVLPETLRNLDESIFENLPRFLVYVRGVGWVSPYSRERERDTSDGAD